MPFYKVTDEEVMKKVDDFFDQRERYLADIHSFKSDMGLTAENLMDNLYFGIVLNELGVYAHQFENEEVDSKVWCRLHRGKFKKFVALKPRANQTELLEKWNAFFNKEAFSYAPLSQLLLQEKVCILTRSSPTFYYVKGFPLLIKNTEYTLTVSHQEVTEEEAKHFFGNREADQENFVNIVS
jgi:hypothetical protein